MNAISPPAHRHRFVWIGLVLLLSLALFTTWYVLAHQGVTNPWTAFYVVRDRRVLSPVISWPLVAWVDSTEPLTAKLFVKNLETEEMYNLDDVLPCAVSAIGRDDIALEGDWLVVMHNCDYPAPAKLYAYNLATSELIWIAPPAGTPPGQDWPYEPEISGNHIVWQQEDWNSTTIDIYLFDLQSRTAMSLTQTTPPWGALHPDISQDWVVWDQAKFGTTEQYLVAFNVTTSEQITVSIPGSIYTIPPSIDEGIIVWTDFRNSSLQGDIYGYDLGSHNLITITTGTNHQIEPAIEGDIVVYWEEVGSSEYVIYGHDLSSNETHLIFQALPDYFIETPFDIDQQVVVWVVDKPNTTRSDIYGAQQLPQRWYLPFLRR